MRKLILALFCAPLMAQYIPPGSITAFQPLATMYAQDSPVTSLPNWLSVSNQIRARKTLTTGVVAVLGDSWVSSAGVGAYMQTALRATYGDAGLGWINFSTTPAWYPNNTNFAIAGTWTTCQETSACVGVNAYHINSSDTATPATATVSQVNATTLVVHYYQQTGGGTFTWSVDGGSGCGGTCSGTQATSGTAAYSTLTIGGLSNTAHSLVLTVTVASTAGVTLMGVDAQLAANGVRVHVLGNTGAKTATFSQLPAATFEAGLQALNPSLVIYVIDTNDQSANVLPATSTANTQTVITEIKAALPNCDILLAPPTMTNNDATATYPLAQYIAGQSGLAGSNALGFVESYNYFGAYASAVSEGLMNANDVHPTPAGAKAFVSNIMAVIAGTKQTVVSADNTLLDQYYTMGANGNVRVWSDESVGSTLVTNGTFASGTGWTLNSGWAISGGALNGTAATSQAYQAYSSAAGVFFPGQVYRLTYTISSYSAGTMRPEVDTNQTWIITFQTRSANGTYTEFFSIPSNMVGSYNNLINFIGKVAFTGSISNVSIVPVTGGDLRVHGTFTAPGVAHVLNIQVPTSDTICALGGDTISGLTCNNTTGNNGTSLANGTYATSYTVGAGFCAVGRTLEVETQFSLYSGSSVAGIVNIGLVAATSTLLSQFQAAFNPATSLSAQVFTARWEILCNSATTATISPLPMAASGGAGTNFANKTSQPVTIGASAFSLQPYITYNGATAGNALRLLSWKVISEGTL